MEFIITNFDTGQVIVENKVSQYADDGKTEIYKKYDRRFYHISMQAERKERNEH
jgi:hypothetical protein